MSIKETKTGIDRASKRDGTSINQFVAMALLKGWLCWMHKITFAAGLRELT
jgi:hypothetical protein